MEPKNNQNPAILRQMINAQPENPNPYYNLARILYHDGKPDESLSTLEQLFAKANSDAPGFKTIFSSARSLCEQVQHTLAEKHFEAACDAVETFSRSIEHLTGCPVDIGFGDVPKGLAAIAQTASQSGSGRHIICYNPSFPEIIRPHIIGHELMHFDLEAKGQAAGKARTLAPSPETSQFLLELCSPSPKRMRQLRQQGWNEESISRAVIEGAESLLFNLLNTPTDLVVETRLHERLPILSASQFLTMGELVRRLPDPAKAMSQRGIIPRQPMLIILALWCVRLRFHDRLFGNTTAFAASYADTDVYPLASRLWECWQAATPSLTPGAEYRLIDEFADILGLRRGYDWTTDPTVGPDAPNP
jgi:tetratricopeptide (TPR) repeat protein